MRKLLHAVEALDWKWAHDSDARREAQYINRAAVIALIRQYDADIEGKLGAMAVELEHAKSLSTVQCGEGELVNKLVSAVLEQKYYDTEGEEHRKVHNYAMDCAAFTIKQDALRTPAPLPIRGDVNKPADFVSIGEPDANKLQNGGV